MTLGAQVRYYRQKLGWTLERLADEADVEIGTISALEKRGSERSKYAPALAKALGLTHEQLLDAARDWLDPSTFRPGAAVVARSNVKPFAVPRWLFSQDLYLALRGKKPAELAHIENLMRAHLQMDLLPRQQPKRRGQ